ncbi:MAG: MCP four helix bundle domain-containing protein [Phycisphaerae bacterium]|nr:MCP four helix bundle domain-containing protein [Phycisphaerae bacterium]
MNPHDSLPGSPLSRPQGYELRPRLLAAFLGMGFVILAASVFAALILRSVDLGSKQMLEDLSARVAIVSKMRQEFLLLRVAEKNLIIEDTQEGMEVFEKRIANSESQIDRMLEDFHGKANEEERARLAEFESGLKDFRLSLKEVMALSREHSLSRAAELSRGKGREEFQRGREALIGLIERYRERIAKSAGDPAGSERVNYLTQLIATARDALEGMHDLQYLEQAILTVFSGAERAAISDRLESQEVRVRGFLDSLRQRCEESDRMELAAFGAALDEWSKTNDEVCRLAREDSKAKAMALSTTAVRDAYLRSSATLDRIMQESDRSMSEMRAAQEKALTASRGLLIGLAAAGLLVVSMAAWVVVSLLMREFRTAGELLMRGV